MPISPDFKMFSRLHTSIEEIPVSQIHGNRTEKKKKISKKFGQIQQKNKLDDTAVVIERNAFRLDHIL